MTASTRDDLPTKTSSPQPNLNEPLLSEPEVHINMDADHAVPDPAQLDSLINDFMKSVKESGRDSVSSKMLAAQIILAFVGLFAGFLYFDPAAQAAAGATDDEWLAKAIPPEVVRQYLYFLSGFIGFGSTNCTFSYYGPQEYIKMLSRMNSRLAKVLATGGVVGFTLLQGLQISLAAEGTGSSMLNMTMTVTGSLPGAINGAVGLVSNMPKIAASISEKAKKVYYNCRVKHLSMEKRHEMAVDAFYAWQRKNFNELIAANWKSVVANVHTLEVTGDENPIDFLLSQAAPRPQKESWLMYGARKFMQLGVGGTLTAAFSAPMLNNTFQVLEKKIDDPIARAMISTALCATTLYGNVSLMNKAVTVATDAAASKLKGEPIDSLIYQLRPWEMRGMILASAVAAGLSYSVVDMMFQKFWAPEVQGQWGDDAQSFGRGFARTGIDIYHVMGPVDVGSQLLFRRMLAKGTPREKFLAHLLLAVNYMTHDMSQKEFIRQVGEELKPEGQAKLGVQSWSDFIAKIKQAGGYDDAMRAQMKEMGLEEFAEDILALALTPPVAEVSVTIKPDENASANQSPSAKHWGSGSYVFSPKSGRKVAGPDLEPEVFEVGASLVRQ
jgi:hypothetical protein